MKKVLLSLTLLITYLCNAQNYQCLQNGVKHYFINGNGYLRGIKIDSVRASGSCTLYFPFHTPRGPYNVSSIPSPVFLDSNGGSWLGKKVKQLSDGTFIFDSYWNDSVIIKPQANVGDNWIFYSDSSTLYYKATVVAKDTATVLSTLDSVKKIRINAYIGSSIVSSDPLNGFTISLSKDHGFAETFDLYTFPYHKPDSVYRLGLDFFLDRSTCGPGNINGNSGLPLSPAPNITVFKLTNFINPNEQQLRNWDVGDVIQSDNITGIPFYTDETISYLNDTITNKTTSGHFINYTVSGSTGVCYFPYPCAYICAPVSYSFSDLVYPLIDTSLMPESSRNRGNYVFYYPKDSSYCFHSPAYQTVLPAYNPWGLGWVYESISYKLGLGKTKFVHMDGDPVYEWDDLLYYSIHGVTCGVPLAVSELNIQAESIALYPNPASTQLSISSQYKITSMVIYNLMGQVVINRHFDSNNVSVDIDNLPNGVYVVRVNDLKFDKFVKQN